MCPPFRSFTDDLWAPKPLVAQWRRVVFPSLFVRRFPVACAAGRIRRHVRSLAVGPSQEQAVDRWRSAIGVPLVVLRWTQDTAHRNSHRQFTRKRIITGRGMATYIQWRRIPDRSESVSKSNGLNVKSPNSRSQFTHSSPTPLSTRPNSRQPAFQNCNNLLAIAPIQMIQIPLDV